MGEGGEKNTRVRDRVGHILTWNCWRGHPFPKRKWNKKDHKKE